MNEEHRLKMGSIRYDKDRPAAENKLKIQDLIRNYSRSWVEGV